MQRKAYFTTQYEQTGSSATTALLYFSYIWYSKQYSMVTYLEPDFERYVTDQGRSCVSEDLQTIRTTQKSINKIMPRILLVSITIFFSLMSAIRLLDNRRFRGPPTWQVPQCILKCKWKFGFPIFFLPIFSFFSQNRFAIRNRDRQEWSRM